VVINGISNGKVIPGHAGFAQIQQTVRAGLDAIWVPNADIPAAMQSICDRINPLLQQ
jgi:multiple sugar transport system substrate-binding protein